MLDACDIGCRKIQFIGGEPQLHRDFPSLLKTAKELGFEFIEVFSNLTQLRDDVVGFSSRNKIRFATSVYSSEPSEHDAITKVTSSFTRTIGNLKKLIASGIETRAGIIAINQSKVSLERTREFLIELGVTRVGVSALRAFGRGEDILSQDAKLTDLCGNCWDRKLCIAPDGAAYPCVMARQWPVGNVLESPLDSIVRGDLLEEMRGTIFEEVWLERPRASADH
ncbi:hypothetical protein A6U85_32300 [Agrobacterium sp. 13-626]|nr:hypothetical protein A6U85_32300 [Agrobacterium sp. 13-626]